MSGADGSSSISLLFLLWIISVQESGCVLSHTVWLCQTCGWLPVVCHFSEVPVRLCSIIPSQRVCQQQLPPDVDCVADLISKHHQMANVSALNVLQVPVELLTCSLSWLAASRSTEYHLILISASLILLVTVCLVFFFLLFFSPGFSIKTWVCPWQYPLSDCALFFCYVNKWIVVLLLLSVFCVSVKCIKNTPGYFAERLYKAMRVGNWRLCLFLCFGISFYCIFYWYQHTVCVHLFRELAPKTEPWSVSWSPALRWTCWIFARSMSGTMASPCIQPSV